MDTGMRELTILYDCSRYSLNPPEKVFDFRFHVPIAKDMISIIKKRQIKGLNTFKSLV